MKKNNFDGQRAWFSQAKFGMFLHLGLYTWMGENENSVVKGDKADYAAFMKQVKLEQFNADEWVQLAIDAGCSYIVPTVKHEEGFCWWQTTTTPYNVGNTPFKRDLLAELSKACQKRGIKLGLYYNANTWLNECDGSFALNAENYPQFVEAQLLELMTCYGPIVELWFDHSDPLWPEKAVKETIAKLKKLQPALVVNDRAVDGTVTVGKYADFVTPERHIPDYISENHRPFECCDSIEINGWGFMRDTHNWSVPELIKRLTKVSSLGGNYLLNVSPTAAGNIRREHAERMLAIGKWLKTHNEAIFGTDSCPLIPEDNALYHSPPVGSATIKDKTIYLFINQWVTSDTILLPHLKGKVKKLKLLGNENAELSVSYRKARKSSPKGSAVSAGLVIAGLPPEPPSVNTSVIKIEFTEKPVISLSGIKAKRLQIVPVLDGETVYLKAEYAELKAKGGIPWHRVNRFTGGKTSVGHIIRKGTEAVWSIEVETAGVYMVFADLGTCQNQADGIFIITACGQTLQGKTVENGFWDYPERMAVGKIDLQKGKHKIALKFIDMPNCFSDVHAIVLQPVR